MSQSTISATPTSSSQPQAKSQTRLVDEKKPHPFAKYENRIGSVRDKILPKQPYLITIPSDFPYRRHTTDPNRWYLNTPFSRREEQLQYMSLLLHQSDDESLLKVDGTRIDEDGKLLPPAPSPRSELPSRPDTPIDTGPKKKITLKDYKTKDRSGVNTPETRPSDDIRKQALKSHKEDVAVIIKEDPPTKPTSVPPPETKAEPVAPTAPVVKQEARPTPPADTQRSIDSQRPVKKRKLSDDTTKPVLSHKPQTISKVDSPGKRQLPPLLNPDLPATGDKKPKTKNLPALLSPKLPAALEQAATTPIHRSDEVRNILKSSIGSPAKSVKKEASESTAADAGRVRSDSQLSARPVTPNIKVSSPVPLPTTTLPKPTTPLPNGRVDSPKPRQRHIIVLKYGKKNRRRVQALLKFAPRPAKAPQTKEGKEKPVTPNPVVKQDTPKLDKKRPASPLPDASVKKTKTNNNLGLPTKSERPTTPKPDEKPRPGSAFSTPKKEYKSIAMQRVASTDTLDAHTPQESGRASTPLSAIHSLQPKTSPAPTSTPAPTSGEHVTWSDVTTRIFALGRLLKKEGQSLANEGSTSEEKRKGVVILVEALLCFMINSGAQAHSRPNADPGWSTIFPYFMMVFKQSRSYKHLNGLVVQLGAIIRQQLLSEHMRRLSKETLPSDDHSGIGSAPTPGSDGAARSDHDSTKKQKSFIDLRDEMVQNSRELRLAWLESSRLLPAQVVEEQYPSTWGKRMKPTDLIKRNPEKVRPGDLPKEFPLPLDSTVNVFEATNFALAFLWEWTMIEQVGWKTRIEL